MRVPVRDHLAVRERVQKTSVSPLRGPCIVDEAHAEAFGLHDESSRQLSAQGRLVHVSVYRSHRADLAEFREERGRRQVSNVQDQRRALKKANAGVRQLARASRQMRVSNERDQLCSARNLPSR
jgi:hypothetical protein